MEVTEKQKYGGFPATESPRRQSEHIEDRRNWKSIFGPNMDFEGFEDRFDPNGVDNRSLSFEEMVAKNTSRVQKQNAYADAFDRRNPRIDNGSGISLDTAAPINLLSLKEPPPDVPQDVADIRSQKAEFAFGEKSPGQDILYNQILSGHEGTLRDTLAAHKQMDYRQIKDGLLQEFSTQRATSGKPLSKDEYDFIASLTADDIVNPDTILEKEYARSVVRETVGDSRILAEAMAETPEASNVFLDVAEQTIAKREIVQSEIDKLSTEWEDSSWFSSIWDFGETLIPFKSALTVSGTVLGSGSALEDYVVNLYRLPVDEFQKKFQLDLEDIRSRNALDAQHFAGLVLSYGTSAKFLDNALNVADALSIGSPLAKGAVKGALATEKLSQLGQGLKSTIRSLRTQNINAADTLAAAGKIREAGWVNFLKEAKAKYYDKDPEGLSKTLLSHMPTFMNPSKFFGGGYQMARESADRIAAKAERNAGSLLRGLTDKTNINTLSDAALARAYDLAEQEIRGEFTHLNNSILDITRGDPEETLPDVGTVRLHLGLPEGKPFENKYQAEQWRKEYGLSKTQARSIQQGDSFVIEITHPIREDLSDLKNLLIETENKTPTSSVNSFIGSIRSADDNLSESQRKIRKVVTHGTQFLSEVLETVAGDLRGLSGASRTRFERFAEQMRDFTTTGPKGEKLRGRDFTTLGDFEEAWQESFSRLPTEQETAAYLSYQQLYQFDYLVRNLTVYKHKTRLGIRHYKADNKSAFFEGRTIPKIDWNVRKQDGTVGLLVYSKDSDPFYTTLQFAKASVRELVDDSVANDGYRIIQTWDPFDDAFKGIANGPVNLVVTKQSESRNLPFEQIPYRPGGHVVYDYGHYVKQPSVKNIGGSKKLTFKAAISWDGKVHGGNSHPEIYNTIRADLLKNNKPEDYERFQGELIDGFTDQDGKFYSRKEVNEITNRERAFTEDIQGEFFGKDAPGRTFYNGDRTVSPFTTEAEARAYVRNMEEARRLYNTDSPEAFDDFVWKNLPVAPQDLRQKFASGILDKAQPFVHVRKGESSKQHLPESRDWIDWNESSYNLSRGMNKEFLGQRNWDSLAVSKSGTDENPIFELTKPRLLDPLSTINRAAGTIIRNQYLEPYKIRSAESFVEEFHTVFKGNLSLEQLRRDPIGFLFEPSFDEGTSNRELLAAAKNYRAAVLDLLGVRSPFQRNWGRVQEKLLNSVYNKLGQGASDWTYEKLLPSVRDPVKFGRQVAFHSKLGLLNPVQLFLQAQTFVHTAALSSPATALKAAPGAVLMRLAEVAGRHAVDDSFLNKWSSYAAAMGWNADDFKEAYRYIRRSGLFNVNGEHAWRDDMLDPKLLRSTAGVVLDKAAIFFTEGERFNRLAAFNAAYLDWRRANPLAKFDRKAQEQVMARQDILSVNMTRASNASWQKGILSVPTQFFSYQQRLFEQLVGKRLTPLEKTRVLAVYSSMYGVPVAAGAATMWPMYETVKSYLLENGIAYDNVAFEAIMEGIPAVAIEAITGTQYNIGDRYGPGGLKDLRDIWWGDKALLEVALGASGSILGDILRTTKPFLYSVAELHQEGSKALPLVGQDFVDALSNVSSVNNAYRAYYALQYGKLITKGEVPIDDVSTFDAIVTGITGLQPGRIGDMYLMIESMKHQKDAQQFARQQAIKYFRRMVKAPDEDKEMYARMYKTWIKLGGFTVNQYSQILKDAAEGYEDLLGSIEKRFWESAPPDQAEPRMNQYQQRIQ